MSDLPRQISPPAPDAPPTPRPPQGITPSAYPLGIAPLAVSAEARPTVSFRGRRARLTVAAAVTGAMALLPLAGPTAHARERDRHEMRVASAEIHLRTVAHDLSTAGEGPAGTGGSARRENAAPGRGAAVSQPAPGRPAAAPSTAAESAEAAEPAAPAEGPADTGAGAAATTPGDDAGAAEAPPARPSAPTPIVAVSGIRLLVPSMDTVIAGFHEAAMPGSLEMASVAPLEKNHNPKPMPAIAKTQDEQVAPVMVLPTRDRAQPPSSAIDVAIPAGKQVTAPVDGTVTAVLPYTLYGQHPDHRIEIQPAGRPDLRVIMIHVSDVSVASGDQLKGGETVVAGSATQFPFESQIDRFAIEKVGKALPHVHMEVKKVG